MTKVLFVCLGNICRSPLAEAIFDHKCKLKGFAEISSDSAGTGAYHIGSQPDPRTIKIAQENDVYINHRARQFKEEDSTEFNYIFAMDESNYENIIVMLGYKPDHLFLLREFEHNFSKNDDLNVPDPYYGGSDEFKKIFDMMSISIENFIDEKLR